MKTLRPIVIVFLTAVVAGCAAPGKVSILQPIGPDPAAKVDASGDTGVIQVFSGRERALGHAIASDVFDNEDPGYESAHTDYTIYDASGKVVKEVRNARFPNDSTPTLVKLPAGQYRIEAKGEVGDGWSRTFDIPVRIQKGRKTVVHLEPDWSPSKQFEGKGMLVHADDGRTIGWQANP